MPNNKEPSRRASDALSQRKAASEAKSILVKWIEEPATFSVLPFSAISSLNEGELVCGDVYLIQTTIGAFNGKLIQIGTFDKCESLLQECTNSGSGSGFTGVKRQNTQSIESPSKARKTYSTQLNSTPKPKAPSKTTNTDRGKGTGTLPLNMTSISTKTNSSISELRDQDRVQSPQVQATTGKPNQTQPNTSASASEAVDQAQEYDPKLLLAKLAQRDMMLREATTSLKSVKEENTVLKERLAHASSGLSKLI
jgi:hypothetical protein